MKAIVMLVLLGVVAGCSSNQWQVRSLPQPQAVAAALDAKPDPIAMGEFDVLGYPKATMPQSVRPCCAFGNNHKIKMGATHIPFYRFSNTVSIDDIGPHAFDAGNFSHQKGLPNGRRGGENNGLIYTLKGGFIDLAHVRDTADNTVALFYLIQRRLGQEFTVALPDEIGQRYIQFHAFDTSTLSATALRELAIHVAARQAYFMAEAHEIAQWHGYRTLAPWSETVSAYSPEDLYSNMLGAKIATALLSNNLAMNTELYNQHMTQWLDATLRYLVPVDKAQTAELLEAVDGLWWDSSEPLPSKAMLLLRHYQMGDEQKPYLVPFNLVTQQELTNVVKQQTAHRLSLPASLQSIELDDIALQHLFVAERYQASFEHIPERLWRDGFTHLDFMEVAQFDQQFDEAASHQQEDAQ
ncbi:DUF4056 domain-containing protein [Shewanella waksmanii]|uniref:DUF4056 domain-containing protein n=1 Tax=Shewanella waksmanii TaxID=213783 RepID=UPI003736545D